MTDDVKDALEEVRRCAENQSDPTWALNHLLAHIDGEAARIAAAVAEERRKVVAYLRRAEEPVCGIAAEGIEEGDHE